MYIPRRRLRAALIGSLAAGITVSLATWGLAASPSDAATAGHPLTGAAARQAAFRHFLATTTDPRVTRANSISLSAGAGTSTPVNDHGADDGDLADQFAQYYLARTAPAGYVTGNALGSAAAQAAALPSTPGQWQEFTTNPYNGEPSDFTDPFWSNIGAGFRIVAGRVTALAATRDAWFAGAADGGVWRSFDQGAHWAPVFDNQPGMSIGSLAVNPADGSLWVGTGEANESQDSYQGTGVWVTRDDGRTFQQVGGSNSPIAPRTVFRVTFSPSGDAFAATNNGLFRYSPFTRAWTEVLDPAGVTDFPPYDQQVTDVAVVPGSHGRDVIAAIGWHGPANIANNGFYESADGGATFAKVATTGALDSARIGRTTFAYSRDGSKLYAIVEDATSAASTLYGLFSVTGSGGAAASVTGPWTLIGDKTSLGNSGSALPGSHSQVGVQAWYNQALIVDPANASHVYASLEEVFESSDGGATWNTATPYWNYPFACDATLSCPPATHPDQHALMITAGKVVIGNDGGVYSRPLSDTQQYVDWADLNATLHNLQFYDARAGKTADGSTTAVGGLQDNGTLVNTTGASQSVEPAGGDGFYVIVDPANASNWVGEYVGGAEYSTQDGGHSFNLFVSPTCAGQATVSMPLRPDCDPNARFVTPMIQDQQAPTTWLTGGEFVWVTTNGWNTSCTDSACDWAPVFDTGAGHAVTALSSANNGKVIYAAWVAGGGNPGPAFASGIATNYGGTWHQIDMSGLPNRLVQGVTVDPANPAHAYAVFQGFSRRFIPGGGVGHVFETFNGGASWTDISGNLPDIASDALVLSHGQLALATDDGVFTARAGRGAGTAWARLGTGLPNVAVDDLTSGPGGYVYAATHGRGIWRFRL
jgi:sugar lactone lactonase YvrE